MKTIRKNFLLLAFAAGALFLIGNNVMAEIPDEEECELDDGAGTGITCHTSPPPDGAYCWRLRRPDEPHNHPPCIWTGFRKNRCWY